MLISERLRRMYIPWLRGGAVERLAHRYYNYSDAQHMNTVRIKPPTTLVQLQFCEAQLLTTVRLFDLEMKIEVNQTGAVTLSMFCAV